MQKHKQNWQNRLVLTLFYNFCLNNETRLKTLPDWFKITRSSDWKLLLIHIKRAKSWYISHKDTQIQKSYRTPCIFDKPFGFYAKVEWKIIQKWMNLINVLFIIECINHKELRSWLTNLELLQWSFITCFLTIRGLK